ncbi:hypothetical protein SAMN05880566_101423 [Janthinobacterium sp. TND4EL3]|nr:hypothetical protein SAMN05880566_101423 [Janthinobacterium sp. TND4EL3]
MQLNGKVAALCLAACASQLSAAPSTHRQALPGADHAASEVRTRDLLLFGAGLILLAGRRRPGHERWQDPLQDYTSNTTTYSRPSSRRTMLPSATATPSSDSPATRPCALSTVIA